MPPPRAAQRCARPSMGDSTCPRMLLLLTLVLLAPPAGAFDMGEFMRSEDPEWADGHVLDIYGEYLDSLHGYAYAASKQLQTLLETYGSQVPPAMLFRTAYTLTQSHKNIFASAVALEPGYLEGRELYCPYVYKGPAHSNASSAAVEQWTVAQWEGAPGVGTGFSKDLHKSYVLSGDGVYTESAWFGFPRGYVEIDPEKDYWWSKPYFDAGGGEVYMVTFSQVFYDGYSGKVAGVVTFDVETTETTCGSDSYIRSVAAGGELAAVSGRPATLELQGMSCGGGFTNLSASRSDGYVQVEPSSASMDMRLLEGFLLYQTVDSVAAPAAAAAGRYPITFAPPTTLGIPEESHTMSNCYAVMTLSVYLNEVMVQGSPLTVRISPQRARASSSVVSVAPRSIRQHEAVAAAVDLRDLYGNAACDQPYQVALVLEEALQTVTQIAAMAPAPDRASRYRSFPCDPQLARASGAATEGDPQPARASGAATEGDPQPARASGAATEGALPPAQGGQARCLSPLHAAYTANLWVLLREHDDDSDDDSDESGQGLQQRVSGPSAAAMVQLGGGYRVIGGADYPRESCEAGTRLGASTEASACVVCPAGTFSEPQPGSLSDRCTPCPPGTYQGESGRNFCLQCDEYSYQPSAGNSLCLPCPAHTVRHMSERVYGSQEGTSLAHCSCQEGFYQRDGLRGLECSACPEGAECSGRMQPPHPLPGYWTDFPQRRYYLQCKPQSRCPQLGGESLLTEQCAEGYAGRLCSMCAEDHYSIGAICYRCTSELVNWLWIAFAIMMYRLINRASSTVLSFSMFLSFLQLLSIQAGYNLQWPERLTELTNYLSLAMLEIDWVSPHCSYPGYVNGFHSSLIQWSLQPVVLTCALISFGIHWVLIMYPANERHNSRLTAAALHALHYFATAVGIPVEESPNYWSLCLHTYLVFAVDSYATITDYTLAAFQCTDTSPSFLQSSVSLECWAGRHLVLLGYAAAALGFIVALPVGLFRAVWRAQAARQLHHPQALCLYGFLYDQYRVECWWFDFVHIGEIVLFVAISRLVTEPLLQVYFSVMVALLVLGLNLLFEPHTSAVPACMEIVYRLVLILLAISGMIFEVVDTPALKQTFEAVDLTMVAIVIAASSLIVMEELWEMFFRFRVKQEYERKLLAVTSTFAVGRSWSRMSKTSPRAMASLPPDHEETSNKPEPSRIRKLSTLASTSLKRLLSRGSWATRVISTQLKGLHGAYLRRPLRWFVLGRDLDDEHEIAEGLHNSLHWRHLQQFLHSSTHQELSVLNALGVRLDPVLTEDSWLGPLSINRRAVALRRMVRSLPSLLDYICVASPAERAKFQGALESFLSFQAHLQDHPHRLRAGMFREGSRAAIVHWLMFSASMDEHDHFVDTLNMYATKCGFDGPPPPGSAGAWTTVKGDAPPAVPPHQRILQGLDNAVECARSAAGLPSRRLLPVITAMPSAFSRFGLSPRQMDALTRLFQHLDANSDAGVSPEELGGVLARVKKQAHVGTGPEVVVLMNRFNKDGDERLDLDEFVAMFAHFVYITTADKLCLTLPPEERESSTQAEAPDGYRTANRDLASRFNRLLHLDGSIESILDCIVDQAIKHQDLNKSSSCQQVDASGGGSQGGGGGGGGEGDGEGEGEVGDGGGGGGDGDIDGEDGIERISIDAEPEGSEANACSRSPCQLSFEVEDLDVPINLHERDDSSRDRYNQSVASVPDQHALPVGEPHLCGSPTDANELPAPAPSSKKIEPLYFRR